MNMIWIKGNLFMFKQKLLYSNLAIILAVICFIVAVIFGEVLYINTISYVCLILTLIFSTIYGMSIYVTDYSIKKDEEVNVINNKITSIDTMINNLNDIAEITKEKVTSNTVYVLKKQVKKKHHTTGTINYNKHYTHKKIKKY